MGWSYRKSINAGPFRVNVSRSGVGYSVGGRGFRVGVNGQGRRYTSVSIPGTGVYFRKSHGRQARGCASAVAFLAFLGGAGLCSLASLLAVR